jgi:hypothetical protein
MKKKKNKQVARAGGAIAPSDRAPNWLCASKLYFDH